ncbi:hypothetical protein NCU17283 [Neurospora crassa OR74A]|uniref:Uncharacterized protein n=1 Tax=Neurospora crassa (strain ATCC 24698 / 74-OR23-1A / CBS 708.71 / DSM 1257 / FGSC 987) TaxID=367110 RepID=V5IL82_NEUCR|nr:hypothetical protein NCU17283 [Neurospora crassa OR74A]ESA42080.1 hypothetical protein NCU17283 [Neurospora crassa OR74A]|eukprot:XP_011395401.1 hypothetical protein NCU17283 [Neurospora crassa OR74A]
MDENDREPSISGPGLKVTSKLDDLLGFPLEVSAVQFFQFWWLLTMKRLARCPIDEWTMGQEEVRQDGPQPTRGVLTDFRNFWRFLVHKLLQRYLSGNIWRLSRLKKGVQG